MPTALYRVIVALLLLLPLAAQADDASDFAAANNSQQAQLLERWAAQPAPARVELINSLQQGQLTVDGQTKTLRLNNRLRGLIDTALASHQLLASDPKLRLSAAQHLQKSASPAQLSFLDRQLAGETDSDVHTALSLALANLQLVDPDPAVRLAAVRLLGETGEPLARTRLETLLQPGVETDATVHTAAETTSKKRFVHTLFHALFCHAHKIIPNTEPPVAKIYFCAASILVIIPATFTLGLLGKVRTSS